MAVNWQDVLSGASGLFSNLFPVGAGTAAVLQAYNRLGNIGEAAQQGAAQIANQGLEQTQFKPFSVASTTGGAYNVGQDGNITMSLGRGEQEIQNTLMNQARAFMGSNPYGQAAGRNAMQSAYGLGQDFMSRVGADTGQRESEVYERIRALQRDEEQTQRLGLEERLANQGRLGVRTSMFGGTPEQLALSKAQEQAKNQAALQAMQQAQAEQLQQANIGSTFAGLGSQLSARDLAAQAAQQQLGLGALAGSYVPQSQLLNVQSASQLYPQLMQRGQIAGAGLFGEASMGGLEALLGSGLGQANLMGQLGTGLLSGLATPTENYGGLSEIFGNIGDAGKTFLKGLFG